MNRIHEELPLLAQISPQTVASTPVLSSYVDAGLLHELFAEFQVGNMAAETLDFAIYQATDGSGTGAKVLKAATQLAAHASNNDNKVVQISARADQLDHANGFRYVALRMVTGGATGGPASATLRGRMRSKTGSQIAAVAESAIA